jgi:hypothetical protein
MFFIQSSMEDYKTRQHPKINGMRTTRNSKDAENEQRARYVLSQHFRTNVNFFSKDSHCKIDFSAVNCSGETVALFEFKKRGNNHNDYRYRKGYWIPFGKLNELVRYGIHERKKQGKSYILDLFYCWGFDDVFLYINVQKAQVWQFDLVEGGLGYSVKEKKDNGRELVYLVPTNHPMIKQVSPIGLDLPWRYGRQMHPWT